MSNRSVKFAAALAAGLLAGASSTAIAQNAAKTADTKAADSCLSGPKGTAPTGSHWFYHLDRTTKKQCWYLGEAKSRADKAAKAATAQQQTAPASDASAADATPPQPQPAMRKSVADAHAEVVSPPATVAPAATTDVSDAGNPAPDASAAATPPEATAPSSPVTARWFDASSMSGSNGTRLAVNAPPPATTQADARPQAAAAAPAAPAAVEAPAEKPSSSSTQMLLIVMVGALALAGLVSALVFRQTRTRSPPYEIRDEWRAPWDSLSSERAPPISPRRERPTRAFSSEVDTGSREENASKQESRAPFRFHRNGNSSGLSDVPPRRAEPPIRRREPVRDPEQSEDSDRQIAEMLKRLARTATN